MTIAFTKVALLKDTFWGAYLDNGVWIGDNMLGKIWMEYREDY